MSAKLNSWLPDKPSSELARGISRLRETDDVRHVAIMPDAHVAEDVCVSAVAATETRILPAAVGNDIGCGMLALRFDLEAERLREPGIASSFLDALGSRVPWHRHRSGEASSLPEELLAWPLSTHRLEVMKEREARLEFGTLGRGNHFVELQCDEEGWLWLMLHSGSRAMGPAIRRHHEAHAPRTSSNLAWLDADTEAGRAYLSDAAWAGAFARESRRRMKDRIVELLAESMRARADHDSIIDCDHNHVRRELHLDAALWVHRKGALSVPEDSKAVIPGSMGSASYHVRGRGQPEALASASHGAGRVMSRTQARRVISARRFAHETKGVWLDARIAHRLREEAPSAYKDIGVVMRAQRDLVRIIRRLEPIVVYKAL